MEDAEGLRSREEGIRINPNFMRSPGGFLIFINVMLLTVAWVIMAAEVDSFNWSNSRIDFFLFATLLPWLFWITVLLLFLFNVVSKMTFINVPITLLVSAIIDGSLLLVASSLVADQGRVWDRSNQKAAAAFGFLAMVGFLIQGFFLFRDRNDLHR